MRDYKESHFIKRIAVALLAVTALFNASAQEAPQVPTTLFPYPVAPDTISTLEGRTNYIVSKF